MIKLNDYEKTVIEWLLPERERILLAALSGERVPDEEARLLSLHVNADEEDSLYLMLLGVLGYRMGWEIYPESLRPRLKGLHRYYQVRNSAVTPMIANCLAGLRDADIPVMFTGDMAMRTHYAKSVPRLFRNYSLAVPSDRYDNAAQILRRVADVGSSSVMDQAVEKLSEIVLVRGAPSAGLFSEKEFWKDAVPVTFCGQDVFVPATETMLLSLFLESRGPEVVLEDQEVRTRRLADCCAIIGAEDPVDLRVLAGKAAETGNREMLRTYMRCIAFAAPGVISGDTVETFFPATDRYPAHVRAWASLCKAQRKLSEAEKTGHGRGARFLFRKAQRSLAWRRVKRRS